MCVYDCNSMMTTAMKNRSNQEMIRPFTELTKDLKIRGINPGFHFIGNEASTALKIATTTMNINYQLVLPSKHRTKIAEREIHTFKNHFAEGLCSIYENFHLQLCDRLIHQAKISLNLLWQLIIHPQLSAYTHIFEEFDYNRTPLAPQGTIVVIYQRPKDRTSWAPHG